MIYFQCLFLGVASAPLYLAVRIRAGQTSCVSWDVKRDYAQFRLCCDENYQYYPEDVECPVQEPPPEPEPERADKDDKDGEEWL